MSYDTYNNKYRLQKFGTLNYYCLVGVKSNAKMSIIRRKLSNISDRIWIGYECDDDAMIRQWTDFAQIRKILTNISERKCYDKYKHHARKFDISTFTISKYWKSYKSKVT